MSFSKLFPIFLLILAAALTSWLLARSFEAPVASTSLPQNPDAYMYNVTAVRTNALSGTLQDQLFTPEMIHYSIGDTTNITTPHLIIFNSSGEPWNIYANHGQAQSGVTTLQLWDNVRLIQAAGPKNAALSMTTSAMTVFPKDQYAETAQPVTLWQTGGKATSVGLHAYLKTGIIDLLSQARGQYQVTPHK